MDNDNYLTLNEQGLVEMSPVTSRDAQLAFIDNYRQTQADNTAQIGEQAHALGSDLPASQGGLHGPSSYWKSRYQTPQTESRVANLRTAAQLSVLNQLMSNDQANWADRLSQAQRSYNKARLNNALSGNGGGGNGGGGNGGGDDDNVTKNYSDLPVTTFNTTAPREGWSDTNIVQDGQFKTIYTNPQTGEKQVYTNGKLDYAVDAQGNEKYAADKIGIPLVVDDITSPMIPSIISAMPGGAPLGAAIGMIQFIDRLTNGG